MKSSAITSVSAYKVFSDRMQPAIQVVVETQNGAYGNTIISKGLSVGNHEGNALPCGIDDIGMGVSVAVEEIRKHVAPILIGMDASRQLVCDEAILSCGKDNLGKNAVAAISEAILFAGAASLGLPVYKHLGGVRAITLPVPAALAASGSNRYGNTVACGYKPTYCFVAYGFKTYSEASEALWKVYMNWYDIMIEKLSIKMQPIAGMAIPKGKVAEDSVLWDLMTSAISRSGYLGKVGIQADFAATCFYNRERQVYSGLFAPGERSRREQIEMIVSMINEYPFVIVEDPLEEDDFDGFAEITKRTDIQITCDDLVAGDIKRLEMAIGKGAGNAVRIAAGQIGTTSEMMALSLYAVEKGFGIVLCGERGEGINACDYAVGLNAGSAHEYGMCYSGNRLLQIESELGHRARFSGRYGIKGHKFKYSTAE